MKANLCKCNNCDAILIDENPKISAIEYELQGTELYMERFTDENGEFFGCPNCKIDDYLMDM